MKPDFDLWFAKVREVAQEKGVTLPHEIQKEQLDQWKAQYDNEMEPGEAFYNVVVLADAQIRITQNPALDD